MPDIQQLINDLSAEHEELDATLSSIEPEEWGTPTPAPGWSVRDQISHLTFFDEEATSAATDGEAFNARLMGAVADLEGYMNGPLEKGRAMEFGELLEWWRSSRQHDARCFQDG